MIKKYIKKPSVLKAVHWTGHNFNEIEELVGVNNAHFLGIPTPDKIYIVTETGAVYALPGDYVTKDPNGQVSTYTKKVFNAYFEEATE